MIRRAMVRLLPFLALAALSACATPIADIRNREIQDDVEVAGKSLREVRDCLTEALAGLRTPVETGTDERKEITFATPQAGAIFHYTLTATATGVKVEARRKNSIADGFNKARKCYMPTAA